MGEKQYKYYSSKNLLSAILCNDIIACPYYFSVHNNHVLFRVLFFAFLSSLYINHMSQLSSKKILKIVQFGIPSFNSTNLNEWQGIVYIV